MRKIFFAGFLMLALSACSHNPEAKRENLVLMAPPAVADKKYNAADAKDDDTPEKANIDTSKKLIKEGEINFETSSIKETRKKILHSLIRLGGYLAEENETNNSGDNQNTLVLTLRVPTKNFD